MTDDFDIELHDRLAGLASAVPIGGGSTVHAPIHAAVRLGSTSRRFAVSALAPLVVVVVAAIVASVARVGPFGPAATAMSPVVSSVRDGPFDLSIRSAKARYALGEPIDVTGSLTFRGPEASVSIAHGHGSPMAFGVIERVGGVFLTPAWRESCEQSVLERDVPLVRPFAKSGSFSGDDPAASDAAGFFEDPTLVLPAGTWHLYVVADFGVGDCGLDRHLLRVDLAIVVGEGPTDSNLDPVASDLPTPAPQPTTLPNPRLETPPPVPPRSDKIKLRTAPPATAPDGTQVCMTALARGILARNPRTGLGFTDESGTVETDVTWPEGYTAFVENGVATLRGPSGWPIAHEGEAITIGGGGGGRNTWIACGVGGPGGPRSTLP